MPPSKDWWSILKADVIASPIARKHLLHEQMSRRTGRIEHKCVPRYSEFNELSTARGLTIP